MSSALAAPVERFIGDLTPVLARIAEEAQRAKDRASGDVALEAYNIAAAFIDVDGLHTDEELWAFVTTFAPRFDTMLGYATPTDVRKAGLVSGKWR